MVRNIESRFVAAALRLSTVGFRDRTRALAEHMGERSGRVRLYSIEEVAEFAVAEFMHRHGIRLARAFQLARTHRYRIQQAVRSVDEKSDDQFMVVEITGDEGYAVGGFAGAAETHMRGADAMLGLNLTRIIGAVLVRLRDVMNADRHAA